MIIMIIGYCSYLLTDNCKLSSAVPQYIISNEAENVIIVMDFFTQPVLFVMWRINAKSGPEWLEAEEIKLYWETSCRYSNNEIYSVLVIIMYVWYM